MESHRKFDVARLSGSLNLTFSLPTELLALQNVIQDKDVKALLERSISTLSSNVGEKS
jgi:hypothetical protein